jgi:hypothetical protein
MGLNVHAGFRYHFMQSPPDVKRNDTAQGARKAMLIRSGSLAIYFVNSEEMISSCFLPLKGQGNNRESQMHVFFIFT